MCSCKVKTADPEKSFSKNAPKTFPRCHPDSTGGDLAADQTRSEFWCHHIDPAGDIYRNPGGLPGQDGGVADFVPYPGNHAGRKDARRRITGCIVDCHCRIGFDHPGIYYRCGRFFIAVSLHKDVGQNWLKERMRAKSTFRDDDDVIIHQ